MKKTSLTFLLLLLICIFALASCTADSPDGDTENSAAESVDPSVCQHTFGEWETKTEPTCKKAGERIRTCIKCSTTEKETIAKLNTHTPKVDPAVTATCSNKGLTEGSHCSVCNKILVAQNSIAKPLHLYVDRCCSVCGSWEPSEGLEFEENSSGCTLVGIGTCTDRIIAIPSEYNGVPVTEIARDSIFVTDRSVSKIIIPDSVLNVSEYAINVNNFLFLEVGKNAKLGFMAVSAMGGCEVINKTGKAIGKESFKVDTYAPLVINNGDTLLTKYTEDGLGFLYSDGKYYLCDYIGRSDVLSLPALYNGSTYTIASTCFAYKDTISKVIFGTGVEAVGFTAFFGSTLSEVDLTGRLTTLSMLSFSGCKYLKNIVIPDNIVTIESQCFDGSGLVTVSIGRSVKQIEHSVFLNCDKLETLYFNAVNCEKAKRLSGYTFFIKNVIIGKDVENIPMEFMKGCTTLTSLTFEEGSKCKTIGGSAFAETSLTSVIIPETVEYLGGFNECELLSEVYFNAKNCITAASPFKKSGTAEGIVFKIGSMATRLPATLLSEAKLKSLEFEENSSCAYIENIGKFGIKNMTLPDTVRDFYNGVFDLETLVIGEDNPYIDVELGCVIRNEDNALIAVISNEYIIPARVKVILKDAFYYSNVTEIYIPDTVVKMENGCLNSSVVVSVRIPFVGNTVDGAIMLHSLFGPEQKNGYAHISVNYIGYYVPSTLRELIIGGGKIVYDDMIENMGIKIVKISKNVTKINIDALRGVSEIYYEGSEEEWKATLYSPTNKLNGVIYNAEF